MISFNSQYMIDKTGTMSIPEDNDQIYDILFELSNDVRHKILLLLKHKPERVMQIAKKLDLISP